MRYIAVLFVLVLAGCVAHEAVISEISDSALTIQANLDVPQSEVDALAVEGCAIYGKKPTAALSEGRIGEWRATREILYACQ